MVVTRERATEYRRLADECLALARTVATPNACDALIAMAEVWFRLAEQQDTGSMPVEAPDQSQPAMQQQQQIQPNNKKDDKE
jgi:hypothetical protein